VGTTASPSFQPWRCAIRGGREPGARLPLARRLAALDRGAAGAGCPPALRAGGHASFPPVRRQPVRHRQPRGAEGTDLGRFRLGLHDAARQQLAPAHLALPHARCPALRAGRRGPPPGQCPPACGERRAALPGAAGNDRSARAERPGRGALRGPSAPRRVGRLGGRAEGPAQHALRAADAPRLFALRQATWPGTLPARSPPPLGQPPLQAHVGDRALPPAPARPLAAPAPGGLAGGGGRPRSGGGAAPPAPPTSPREASAPGPLRRVLGHHGDRPAPRRGDAGAGPRACAPPRPGRAGLRALPGQDHLAAPARRLLPLVDERPARLGGGGRGGAAPGDHRAGSLGWRSAGSGSWARWFR
jgi:translation initiation factor IF-2